ncbi:hypothetical protein NMG60_11002002 [Bertholletia excelsa]
MAALEELPDIINYIFEDLDLETLCTASCVSRTLRFAASQVLSSSSSIDLSLLSPDVQTLNRIVRRFREPKVVTLDCLRLDDSSVSNLLGEHIQELTLLKGSSLSYQVLASIAQKCPNLRVLELELVGCGRLEIEKSYSMFMYMLHCCSYLESLSVKIRETEATSNFLQSLRLFLPKTLKVLKLQPMHTCDAINFICDLRDGRNLLGNSTVVSMPFNQGLPSSTLQSLSLVLNVICDELIMFITNSLPFLVELDLEDRPTDQPVLPHDLTNSGLQSLGLCQHLTSLSLIRGRQNHPHSFKTINDMGLFLLSECCKGLESVRLGGFSKVSDAGFAAVLHSCPNLKKFEVRYASLLSDLAFNDISVARCSLVDVKLRSCSLITSESVNELASLSNLEVLDLSGCRSIADSCLGSVSVLHKLTTLNIGGADVTDVGLAMIGRGNSPITHFSLRGCKRVSDKGIALLLKGGGRICNTLKVLDAGYLPGISDEGIHTIVAGAPNVTELCLRYCFFLTDVSLETLASKKLLRRLDLFHCIGLAGKSLGFLRKPSFCGLHWLGIGQTPLSTKGEISQISERRPWMTVCEDGCEMGCNDGWQFHKF